MVRLGYALHPVCPDDDLSPDEDRAPDGAVQGAVFPIFRLGANFRDAFQAPAAAKQVQDRQNRVQRALANSCVSALDRSTAL